jgi:hypothetical protein
MMARRKHKPSALTDQNDLSVAFHDRASIGGANEAGIIVNLGS